MTESPRPTDPTRPAARWVRWLVIGVVAIVVLVVLFTLVFPWLERNLSNPTMGAVRVDAVAAMEVMPPGW